VDDRLALLLHAAERLTVDLVAQDPLADKIICGIEGAGWWQGDPERLGWYHGFDRTLGRSV
jgi:hypothetical protein